MKSVLRTTLLAAATMAALGTASTAFAGGRPDLVEQGLKAGKAHVADQLIVQFRDGASAQDRVRAMGRVNGERVQTLVRGKSRVDFGGDVILLNVRGQANLMDAIRTLHADGAVDFAEPNWMLQHAATSNDTYYTNGSLWGMYGDGTTPANQYGSQAGELWASKGADCSNVIVGIIDEGYMHSHPDLAANVFKNPQDSTFDGVDNDGNGYVDDVYGWDFDGGNNSVFDGAGDDHGTHVAGTIGGVGGNGTGVAGMCHSVKLMNAKFLGRRGGATANAILAVDYFTNLKIDQGLNIVATNNSWGGGGYSKGLEDAIKRANAADILFIAAAGNSGTDNDTTASYPGNYAVANVVQVAALQSNGALASYSQYGDQTVHIGAPGSAIMSTVPKSSKGSVIPAYASYSGTSMATPHVTGAAALYAALHLGATGADIKAALLNGVATPSLQGKTITGKRLNVSGF